MNPEKEGGEGGGGVGPGTSLTDHYGDFPERRYDLIHSPISRHNSLQPIVLGVSIRNGAQQAVKG